MVSTTNIHCLSVLKVFCFCVFLRYTLSHRSTWFSPSKKYSPQSISIQSMQGTNNCIFEFVIIISILYTTEKRGWFIFDITVLKKYHYFMTTGSLSEISFIFNHSARFGWDLWLFLQNQDKLKCHMVDIICMCRIQIHYHIVMNICDANFFIELLYKPVIQLL